MSLLVYNSISRYGPKSIYNDCMDLNHRRILPVLQVHGYVPAPNKVH